jgi:hypothetical protein
VSGAFALRKSSKQDIVEIQEPVMTEVVLRINDEISFDRVASFLAPYIEKAEIKELPKKVWTGKAEWLLNPVKMDSFSPLTREEVHVR